MLMLKIAQKIITWIRKEVRQANAGGVVFGLSGGLDSALIAALCRQALGRDKALALILPCQSNKADLADARLIVKTLKIKTKYIDLGPLYKICQSLLPRAGRITQGNLKARLRMAILYYFANKLDYLVCGTSNKSEILTGYFTKFGDAAADILPLADLLKSQVRELAKTLAIPRRIIDKPPTAGLWPAQTDEAELGLSYARLDSILLGLLGKQKKAQPVGLVRKIKTRIKSTEHKRQLPKICRI